MKLSEFEMDVMRVFWAGKVDTAPEVHQEIFKQKDVAYNTVKTIIDRLEKKGAIARAKKEGRTIHYQAVLEADSISKPLLAGFIDRLFGGKSKQLMSHLVEEDYLSDDDLDYLENLIKERRKQNKK